MATEDLNLNSTHCLQTVNDLGVQHFHNICSGAVTDVPWGVVDWIGMGAVGLLLFLFIAMLGTITFMMARDF